MVEGIASGFGAANRHDRADPGLPAPALHRDRWVCKHAGRSAHGVPDGGGRGELGVRLPAPVPRVLQHQPVRVQPDAAAAVRRRPPRHAGVRGHHAASGEPARARMGDAGRVRAGDPADGVRAGAGPDPVLGVNARRILIGAVESGVTAAAARSSRRRRLQRSGVALSAGDGAGDTQRIDLAGETSRAGCLGRPVGWCRAHPRAARAHRRRRDSARRERARKAGVASPAPQERINAMRAPSITIQRRMRGMMGRTLLVLAAPGSIDGYTRRARGVKVRAPWLAVVVGLAWSVIGAAAVLAQEPVDSSVFLNRVILVGNASVSTSELRARMRTREPSSLNFLRRPRLDRPQIDRDIAQLQAYYHAIGYPDATVRLERIDYLQDDRFADVVIRIVEGEAIRVREVLFKGHYLIDDKELREGLLLKPGAAYNSSLLSTDVYRIKGKYFDRGYFGVTVQDSIRARQRQVTIRFTIDAGPQLRIGKVAIEGNRLVKLGVLEGEVTFEPGEVCRYGELIKTQRNLFETGLFTQVDVLPENLDVAAQTVDVRIKVRERKSSWVEVGFGVGSVLGSRVFGERARAISSAPGAPCASRPSTPSISSRGTSSM